MNPASPRWRHPVIDTGFAGAAGSCGLTAADGADAVDFDGAAEDADVAGAFAPVSGVMTLPVTAGVAACDAFDDSRAATHRPPAATTAINIASGNAHVSFGGVFAAARGRAVFFDS